MSMENAILELAAAMRENTAALMKCSETTAHSTDACMATMLAYSAQPLVERTTKVVKESAQELAGDKLEVVSGKDAELEQAVQKVEADAKIEEENSRHAERDEKAQKEEAAEFAALDYAKDVRPVLLAAIKKAGKDAVAAMLTTYGVDKADKLKPEQLPAVLAEAQTLAA